MSVPFGKQGLCASRSCAQVNMPFFQNHVVCQGLRDAEGESEEQHELDEAKVCERGHAWCAECLENDHSTTCDVCGGLNCPECTVYDENGEPFERFIACHDCLRRGIEDGGMQLCGDCFHAEPTYGCCVTALGHVCCPEHTHERVFCECGRMMCAECLAAGRCYCGDFRRADAAVAIEVDA